MFNWLKSLFGGRSQSASNVYHPGEMLIYEYWDGSKMVRADPVSLYKAVSAVGPELSVDIKVSNSPCKDANQAHDEVLAKIRAIFNVKPFTEGGLTEAATVDLFDHFMEFAEGVKKNSSRSSTSSISEDSPPSSEVGQATTNSSDSGSIAAASSTAGPAPSPSALA